MIALYVRCRHLSAILASFVHCLMHRNRVSTTRPLSRLLWQSLVHHSLSTTLDTEVIPEDIAAAITPAAAAEAVYTIRHQRKEEHRRLTIAIAELDMFRAQVGGWGKRDAMCDVPPYCRD